MLFRELQDQTIRSVRRDRGCGQNKKHGSGELETSGHRASLAKPSGTFHVTQLSATKGSQSGTCQPTPVWASVMVALEGPETAFASSGYAAMTPGDFAQTGVSSRV